VSKRAKTILAVIGVMIPAAMCISLYTTRQSKVEHGDLSFDAFVCDELDGTWATENPPIVMSMRHCQGYVGLDPSEPRLFSVRAMRAGIDGTLELSLANPHTGAESVWRGQFGGDYDSITIVDVEPRDEQLACPLEFIRVRPGEPVHPSVLADAVLERMGRLSLPKTRPRPDSGR
jgi:hypothetical protein